MSRFRRNTISQRHLTIAASGPPDRITRQLVNRVLGEPGVATGIGSVPRKFPVISMKVFTIGFTKKSAESFFTTLHTAGITRVVDVRLNNSSQLAGFAKQDDLQYFLKGLYGIEYLRIPELAPTKDILDTYKKHSGDWSV